MLRFVPKTLKEQAAAGALKVEDIKGSSTYAAVAESFGIDLKRLYRELQLDEKQVPSKTMLKDTGKLAGIEGFEADTVRIAVAKILGIPYMGEKGNLHPVTETTVVIPDYFALEGTMSIQEIAQTLSSSPEAVIKKLGLPKDISLDTPLRDMKDQYGYTMSDLKAKIKE